MIKTPKILVIKSDIAELKKVEKFLHDIFIECKISTKNFNKVFLCISEAVVNSIQHGNKNDKNKTVSIGIDCEAKEMNVFIKDEGEGFDISDVADPTTAKNRKLESGRGIHIIKSLTEKIEYNNGENFIQFKIDCE